GTEERRGRKATVPLNWTRSLAETPASTVRVLLRCSAMTHNWRVVSLRAFRLGETEIHETLPVAFVGPSRRHWAIRPSRSPGSGRAKARCSELCAGCSCARDSAVAPACRGRHWQV